ncbi:AlbA family DNA-binding domain-containing protein [Lutimonas sp.]|uniref:AlbA family DNA-binding domain-containing protein n=1 Tax=Lutimonas sp. TaxID=1872403 RepID=UPI003D9BEC7F
MRKYILSIALILCGLVLVSLNFFNFNDQTYAEASFADQSEKFDKIFDDFTRKIQDNITRIKKSYENPLSLKDSVSARDYFLQILEDNKTLNSIGYFQGNTKLVARKTEKSFIVAIDSSSELGVVKWQRFANNKLIGSWYESIEKSIYNTNWYKDLSSHNNELKWYLRERVNTDSPDEDQAFFYAAYSYLVNNKQSAVVLEYSKAELFEEFGISSDKLQPRLSFKNSSGKELHLNSAESENSDKPSNSQGIDSLQLHIDRHFGNFKNIDKGTFNFKYKNQTYWNSFNRLSNDRGIQYYLYTLPEDQLIQQTETMNGGYLLLIGLSFITLGSIILLIRKRFFYRPNRIAIPSVEEILKEEENRYLEFKSSLRWDYRQEKVNPELEKVIMKTIAAFGNTDGGILLIGVDDDKNILGLENDFQTLKKKDADYYEVHLRNLMHKLMGVKYVSKYIRTQFETIHTGEIICKIKVISAKEPLYLKYPNKNGHLEEKFYVRSGNSSHEIKSIAEINDYINSKFK